MDIVLPTWLGSFYGSNFDYFDYERITINKFLPLTRGTADAMKSRWFDYRRLHPLQATYYFYDCYINIYLQLSKKYFGKKALGSKAKDFVEGRERNSFWMLRNFCDIHGFSYPWYLYTMIEYRLESGEFKNRLPRPQHLLRDDKSEIEALIETWKGRFQGDVLQAATDPFYRVERWINNPAQREHEDMLVLQIKNKKIKHYALKTLVYDRHILRFERVLAEFPEEVSDMQKDCNAPTYILE